MVVITPTMFYRTMYYKLHTNNKSKRVGHCSLYIDIALLYFVLNKKVTLSKPEDKALVIGQFTVKQRIESPARKLSWFQKKIIKQKWPNLLSNMNRNKNRQYNFFSFFILILLVIK